MHPVSAAKRREEAIRESLRDAVHDMICAYKMGKLKAELLAAMLEAHRIEHSMSIVRSRAFTEFLMRTLH